MAATVDTARAARDFVAAHRRDLVAQERIVASLACGDAQANLTGFVLALADIAADATREALLLAGGPE